MHEAKYELRFTSGDTVCVRVNEPHRESEKEVHRRKGRCGQVVGWVISTLPINLYWYSSVRTEIAYDVNFAFDRIPDTSIVPERYLVPERTLYPHRGTFSERTRFLFGRFGWIAEYLGPYQPPSYRTWRVTLQQVSDLVELFTYTGHSPDLVAFLKEILRGQHGVYYYKEMLRPYKELPPWEGDFEAIEVESEIGEELSESDYLSWLSEEFEAATDVDEDDGFLDVLAGGPEFELDPGSSIPEPNENEIHIVFQWRSDEALLIHSAFQSIGEMRCDPSAVAIRNDLVSPGDRNPLLWAARHEVSYDG